MSHGLFVIRMVNSTELSPFGLLLSFVIFFFKQKTAYEMRISDWSSDVCSSDLDFCVRDTPALVQRRPSRLSDGTPPQDVAGALQVEGTHHACCCYQYGGELRPSFSELQQVPGREPGEQAGFRLAHREGLGRYPPPCPRHPPEGPRHPPSPNGHP